jgi:hypothetical protein
MSPEQGKGITGTTTGAPLDAALGGLPPRDVDPWRAEQIRRRAQAALRQQAALARRPWLAALDRLYGRVLEPAFVGAVACGYLAWALWTVSDLLSGSPLP